MHAEQSVLDAIAELERDEIGVLVDASLARPITDSYCAPWHDTEGVLYCELCRHEWHGLATDKCPGAWATEEQKDVWHERIRELAPRHIDLGGWRARNEDVRPEGVVQFDEFQIGPAHSIPPGYVNISHIDSQVRSSNLMTAALQNHLRQWPEDREHLVQRFGSSWLPDVPLIPYPVAPTRAARMWIDATRVLSNPHRIIGLTSS